MSDTLLVIQGIGIPPWSARGLTQTLEYIPEAVDARYTWNGTLVNLSQPQLRKYRSVITCRDFRVPAIDGLQPGAEVVVDCIAERAYAVGGTPDRTPVTGSQITENGYVRYRPRLTMLVISCPTSTEEWQAYHGWTIELWEK